MPKPNRSILIALTVTMIIFTVCSDLNTDMSISKVMQLVKGESAFWINKEKLTKTKFEWADEYFAVSVSEDKLDTVRNYIINQEEHHKKITFLDEYNSFLKHFHFEKGQG